MIDRSMGRAPCCEKDKVKRGPWSPAEDQALILFIHKHGHSNWRALPKQAGLLRCGKSCRLRWMNYLRPDVKRGNLSKEEEDTIITLHHSLGNKWSQIASHLPGRTDNEIKNVWNTHLKKRLGKSDDKGRLASSSSKTTGVKDALLHLQPTKQHQLDHTYQEEPSSSSSSSSNDHHHHHHHPAAAHQEVMNLEEADVELWNMLDALGDDDILIPDDHEHDQQQFAAGNYSTDQCDEEERLKWLHYIEHELGLDHDDDNNQLISTYPAAHTTTSSTYLI